MIFTEAEREYLATQSLGRLASIGPGGGRQVNPVTYWVNVGTETIEVGGPGLGGSQKFRNIQADPRISFVVDDVATEPVGPGGQRGRGLEVRGRAEVLAVDRPLMEGFCREVIRIHPRRVIAWNVDGPGKNARNVTRNPAN
ncbi:MAG: PPOX class F420-dependent oxidoreductase [Streptosporangiales bacterium]|nr:PPOX class F420-dependent oxidoreductase [Streptosporangiales bacterium]